jgi:hypothetical protein
MADRKRKVKQAVAESVEFSSPSTVEKPKSKAKSKAKPSTKNFELNPQEKADAAAPMHPRAGKSQNFRKRELHNAISEARSGNPAEGLSVGPSLTGHKQVKNPAHYDSTVSSAKTYRTTTPEQ